MELLRDRLTIVWAALMAATCATTWVLSKDAINTDLAVIGIFGLAGLKVRFVMREFMELRHAPTGARVVFELWTLGVIALILGFWFATPTVS